MGTRKKLSTDHKTTVHSFCLPHQQVYYFACSQGCFLTERIEILVHTSVHHKYFCYRLSDRRNQDFRLCGMKTRSTLSCSFASSVWLEKCIYSLLNGEQFLGNASVRNRQVKLDKWSLTAHLIYFFNPDFLSKFYIFPLHIEIWSWLTTSPDLLPCSLHGACPDYYLIIHTKTRRRFLLRKYKTSDAPLKNFLGALNFLLHDASLRSVQIGSQKFKIVAKSPIVFNFISVLSRCFFCKRCCSIRIFLASTTRQLFTEPKPNFSQFST
jgi:hypothetical protein